MELTTGNIINDLERWEKYYFDYHQNSKFSQNTLKTYEKVLKLFKEYTNEQNYIKSIREIDKAYFIGFLLYCVENSKNKELSHKTKSLYISVLKAFFEYISEHNEEGNRKHNFMNLFHKILPRRNKDTKEFRYLADDEVAQLYRYIEDTLRESSHYSYIYSLGIKLMLDGGLRASEVLNLKLNDITLSDVRNDNNERDSYDIRLKKTKSRKEQHALILIPKIEIELDYFKQILDDEDDIFVGKNGTKKITRSNFYTGISNLLSKAGINRKGLHILRHTCAMRAYRSTGDIVSVKGLLRHSDINTTMIYADAEKSDVANTLRKIASKY